MLGSSWTISPDSFRPSPLSVRPWAPVKLAGLVLARASSPIWLGSAGRPLPGWAAGGSRAGGSGDQDEMPKAAPKKGRRCSSRRQGIDQAPLRGCSHHAHLLLASSCCRDPPACSPEPAAIGTAQVFPTQSIQKAAATLKSLKLNHLRGKLWLGYVSGYRNWSPMLGCDKITYCKNKLITHLGYLWVELVLSCSLKRNARPKQCSLPGCSNREARPAALLPKHTVAPHGKKGTHHCQKTEECNKIGTDSESWPCLEPRLSLISIFSYSAYFSTLLSISVKQGFKIPSYYSFCFFPLVPKLNPRLQWTQSHANKRRGLPPVDLQAGLVPTHQNFVLF